MNDAPLKFRWTGDSFEPASSYWQTAADKRFVIGELYFLAEHQQRSHSSHAHYFAIVNEAWANLPDNLAERFPTADHLRKYALIKTGFFDSQTFVCGSKAEALRMHGFLRPVDEFSVIDVSGCTVTRYVAKSQRFRAMDRKTFVESKDRVLGFLAELLGTDSDTLQKAKAA